MIENKGLRKTEYLVPSGKQGVVKLSVNRSKYLSSVIAGCVERDVS